LLLEVIDIRHVSIENDHQNSNLTKFLDLKSENIKNEPEQDNNKKYVLEETISSDTNYNNVEVNEEYLSESNIDIDDTDTLNEELIPEKPLKCTECPKSFDKPQHLSRHMKRHSGVLHKCDLCPSVFVDEGRLRIHINSHDKDGGKTFGCQYCEETFLILKDLKSHRKSHPEYKSRIKRKWQRKENKLPDDTKVDTSVVCDECGKTFKSKSFLNKHRFLHTGERPYSCDQCSKAFPTEFQLRSHRTVHSDEKHKPFMCDVCSKSFRGSTDLKRHKTIHTGEKLLNCDQCSYATSHLTALKCHIRTHTGERPYVCHICKKTFINKGHMDRHIKGVHIGEKNVFCEKCPKSFLTQEQLKQHKVVHSGEKNFHCDICPKRFTQSSALYIHKHIHTGEKPWTCDVCGMTFGEKGNLNKHKIIHNENREYPFKCDICPKAFDKTDNLQRHRRIHSGEKPFVCSICGREFTENGHLKNHMNRMHSHLISTEGKLPSEKSYFQENLDSKILRKSPEITSHYKTFSERNHISNGLHATLNVDANDRQMLESDLAKNSAFIKNNPLDITAEPQAGRCGGEQPIKNYVLDSISHDKMLPDRNLTNKMFELSETIGKDTSMHQHQTEIGHSRNEMSTQNNSREPHPPSMGKLFQEQVSSLHFPFLPNYDD